MNRRAPTFIPDTLIEDYERFLNICGHNINFLIYIFGNELKSINISYNSEGFSTANFANSNIKISFKWRIDPRISIWKEFLILYFEFGEIKLIFKPAFLRNTSADLYVTNYLTNSVNVIKGDNSWSFINEINSFVDLITNKKSASLNFGSDCINDYYLIDAMWSNLIHHNL